MSTPLAPARQRWRRPPRCWTDSLRLISSTGPKAWRPSWGSHTPDRELSEGILKLMRSQQVDFTEFFRALSAGTARTLFAEPEPFDSWAARREALLPADRAAVADAMDRVNPVYIPRNHRVEEALATATKGDMGPFRQLVDAVSRPFDERPGLADYTRPAPAGPRTSPTAAPEHGPTVPKADRLACSARFAQ